MKLKHFFFFAMAGALATACNETEDGLASGLSNTLKRIQTEGDRFASRFNNATGEWDANDAIGVFMQTAADNQTVEGGWNVRFVTAEGGATADFSTAGMGIPLPEGNVDVFACYPYNPDIFQDYLYRMEVGNQEDGISQYDLMYAKAENRAASELSSGLGLQFAHQLSLVKVNVTLPDNLEGQKVEGVSMNGLNTAGDFNLSTGTWEAVETPAVMNVGLNEVADNAFQCVVLPTTDLSELTLTFTLTDNSTYRFEMSDVQSSSVTSFEKGHEYTFTINLNAPVNGYLDGAEGATSAPWENGGEQGGTADQIVSDPDIPSDYNVIEVSSADDLARLANIGGKVALRFNADVTSGVEMLSVSEKVTELAVKGANETPSSLVLKGFAVEGALSKLSILNMNITGDGGADLLSCDFAEDAAIEIKGCKLSGMKNVLNFSGDSRILASLNVDDCQIENTGSLVNSYRIKEISLTNSTLWKVSGRAVFVNTAEFGEKSLLTNIRVSSCTLAEIGGTPFESNYSNTDLYFDNNISAVFLESGKNNLGYKVTAQSFKNNHAAAGGEDGLLPAVLIHNGEVTVDGGWASTDQTVGQLFTDAASGNFSTTIADAGDPRWRNQ